MSEPMIAWRPGWVSEWDNGVLICIRADQRTTPPWPTAPVQPIKPVVVRNA